MTRAEESALILKIMEGDKDLFRQLVDAHSGMIFSVLYRVTGSREDAEEAPSPHGSTASPGTSRSRR